MQYWPWLRRAAPSPVVAPVPDTDAVRRAALAASWRRDRWVSRRRLWWRWSLWAMPRYVAPAAVVMTASLLTWMHVRTPTESIAAVRPTRSPALPAEPAIPTPRVFSPMDATVAAVADDEAPLALRLALGPAPTSTPRNSPESDAPPPITPTLKPENWLHSKEP